MISRLWRALQGLAEALERFSSAMNGVSEQLEQNAGLPGSTTVEGQALPQLPGVTAETLSAPAGNGDGHAQPAVGRRGRK